MNSIYRFTLNMHSHRSQASVSVFKGDTAIRLIITLVDGGTPFAIKEGCVAILSGTKADGNKLWDRCVIVGNTIQYDFHEQTATCMGITNCEVTLYDTDGSVLTAPKFTIVVDEREITSTDFDSLPHTDVFDQDKLVAIYEAEESRAEAEKQRAEAEVARQGFLDSYRDEVSENIEATVNETKVELTNDIETAVSETKVELASNIETAVNETKEEIYNILGQTIIAETTVAGDPFVTRITGGGLENIVNNSVTELVSVQGSTQAVDGVLVNATFSGVESTNADGTEQSSCVMPSEISLGFADTLSLEEGKIYRGTTDMINSWEHSNISPGTTNGAVWAQFWFNAAKLDKKVVANCPMRSKYIDGGNTAGALGQNATLVMCDKVHPDKFLRIILGTLEEVRGNSDEGAATLAEVRAFLKKRNVIFCFERSADSIKEEEIEIPQKEYTAYEGGTETVIGNGLPVTVTQKYITKVGG